MTVPKVLELGKSIYIQLLGQTTSVICPKKSTFQLMEWIVESNINYPGGGTIPVGKYLALEERFAFSLHFLKYKYLPLFQFLNRLFLGDLG